MLIYTNTSCIINYLTCSTNTCNWYNKFFQNFTFSHYVKNDNLRNYMASFKENRGVLKNYLKEKDLIFNISS